MFHNYFPNLANKKNLIQIENTKYRLNNHSPIPFTPLLDFQLVESLQDINSPKTSPNRLHSTQSSNDIINPLCLSKK